MDEDIRNKLEQILENQNKLFINVGILMGDVKRFSEMGEENKKRIIELEHNQNNLIREWRESAVVVNLLKDRMVFQDKDVVRLKEDTNKIKVKNKIIYWSLTVVFVSIITFIFNFLLKYFPGLN